MAKGSLVSCPASVSGLTLRPLYSSVRTTTEKSIIETTRRKRKRKKKWSHFSGSYCFENEHLVFCYRLTGAVEKRTDHFSGDL